MTGTFKSIVTKPLICCAVALATAIWAGSASAQSHPPTPVQAVPLTLVHQSEHQNLCFNDPYQSSSNGKVSGGSLNGPLQPR
jgi:hypothetical protein